MAAHRTCQHGLQAIAENVPFSAVGTTARHSRLALWSVRPGSAKSVSESIRKADCSWVFGSIEIEEFLDGVYFRAEHQDAELEVAAG